MYMYVRACVVHLCVNQCAYVSVHAWRLECMSVHVFVSVGRGGARGEGGKLHLPGQ